MKKTLISGSVAFLCSVLLIGCTPSISPDEYDTSNAQQITQVAQGVIVSVRMVTVSDQGGSNNPNLAGTLTGAAAGGIAASAIGGGRGEALMALGGAVLGGIAGNKVEQKLTSQQGTEYLIKLNNGQMITVTQSVTPALRAGQHVIVQYSNPARVVADPSYSS